jgi:diaminopimelate decarboxylase
MDDLTNIIQEHRIKLFKDDTIYDIVSTILEGNVSDDPFFVVDVASVIRQYERWRELLPAIEPHYAVKCNSDPVILKVLASIGCSFDVASKGEITTVLPFTSPERLLFANPIKNLNSLKYARAVDVDLMTFDSEVELYKVVLHHPNASLLLRLKVDDRASRCKFSCKFGVEMADVERLLGVAKTLSLRVCGFSFHVGSGCSDPQHYVTAIGQCFDAIAMARDQYGMEATIIDVGGGFESSTFEEFASVIRPLTEQRPDIRWLAEPGRLFVNDSSTLVLNIVGKKKTSEQHIYYLNDSVYGSFNGIMFDHRRPEILAFNERDGAQFKSRVYGCTCDGVDLIANEVMLPDLAVGEWCYAEQMGAYSASAASSFNGFSQTQSLYILTSPSD